MVVSVGVRGWIYIVSYLLHCMYHEVLVVICWNYCGDMWTQPFLPHVVRMVVSVGVRCWTEEGGASTPS